MQLQAEHFTHQGHVRKMNQDALMVRLNQGIFVVCDGMGGYAGGEVASALCVEQMGHMLSTARALSQVPDTAHAAKDRQDALHAAITVANESIHAQAKVRPEVSRMATTVVAAAFTPSTVTVAHVGDSRAYLLRDRAMYALTKDHNMLEALVKGGMPRAEAAAHEAAQVLLNGVGVNRDVDVTVSTVRIQPGDRVLLCSDGLYNEVPEPVIAQLLMRPTAGSDLLEAALLTRCRDNVTAVVVTISE